MSNCNSSLRTRGTAGVPNTVIQIYTFVATIYSLLLVIHGFPPPCLGPRDFASQYTGTSRLAPVDHIRSYGGLRPRGGSGDVGSILPLCHLQGRRARRRGRSIQPCMAENQVEQAHPFQLFSTPMHPALQAIVGGLLYSFHIFVLCKRTLALPSIIGGGVLRVSWEVAFGTSVIGVYLGLAGRERRAATISMLSGNSIHGESLPVKVDESEKQTLAETFIFLGLAYYGSGYVGQGINYLLCMLAALGAPLTIGMCTSLQVLLSHLLWVFAGSLILHFRTDKFFSLSGKSKWLKMDFSGNLVWSVISGYWLTSYISSLALSINSITHKLPILSQLSQLLRNLPESQTEIIVDQLKNPQGGVWAAIAGCVGPCFTGPVWEEFLYRGFLLQALNLFMSLPLAVEISSLVFSLSHMNARAFAHLYVLGWIWSVLYIRTKNLVVPILIHALWNMRTFISPII